MSFSCIFDNPDSQRREFWQDGNLLQSIAGVTIDPSGPAPFTPGKIIGSAEALKYKVATQ